MTTFLEVLAAIATLYLLWWLLRTLLRPRPPADAAEDPLSFVPAPRGMRPKGKSGAIALEEPEENDPTDAFPPREL